MCGWWWFCRFWRDWRPWVRTLSRTDPDSRVLIASLPANPSSHWPGTPVHEHLSSSRYSSLRKFYQGPLCFIVTCKKSNSKWDSSDLKSMLMIWDLKTWFYVYVLNTQYGFNRKSQCIYPAQGREGSSEGTVSTIDGSNQVWTPEFSGWRSEVTEGDAETSRHKPQHSSQNLQLLNQ